MHWWQISHWRHLQSWIMRILVEIDSHLYPTLLGSIIDICVLLEWKIGIRNGTNNIINDIAFRLYSTDKSNKCHWHAPTSDNVIHRFLSEYDRVFFTERIICIMRQICISMYQMMYHSRSLACGITIDCRMMMMIRDGFFYGLLIYSDGY